MKYQVIGEMHGVMIARHYTEHYKASDVCRTLNEIFAPFSVVEIPDVEQAQEVTDVQPVTKDSSQEIPF